MKNANLSATSCNLWVIVENNDSYWWKQLNFNSGFLLSEVQRFRKTPQPLELSHLIQKVKWPQHSDPVDKPWTLVGCKNHFEADWLFLIHDLKEFRNKDLEQVVEQLQVKNLRCFAPFEPSPGLKARLKHCDLVSDSNI